MEKPLSRFVGMKEMDHEADCQMLLIRDVSCQRSHRFFHSLYAEMELTEECPQLSGWLSGHR